MRAKLVYRRRRLMGWLPVGGSMHRRISLFLLLIVGFGAIVSAQTQSDTAFDVASVKRVTEPGMIYGIRPIEPSGRFYAIITVYDLVRVAYGTSGQLVEAQIIDAPSWAKTDRFEINATVAGEFSQDGFLANMRALLTERFKLRVRKETRQLPVYDLVLERAGQTGPRLRRSDGQCLTDPKEVAADLRRACGFKRVTATSISALGIELDGFAHGVSTRPEVQRVVRDRTGLSGRFDIDVEFMPEPDAPAAAFFTAFKEQLGLRFQSASGPLDAYVIERLEPPSPD
jgi:uncharacterized protein (TIGR03435 family)